MESPKQLVKITEDEFLMWLWRIKKESSYPELYYDVNSFAVLLESKGTQNVHSTSLPSLRFG